MKRTSSPFQEYIAYALLISLFLQSCGGGVDNNSLIPAQKHIICTQTNIQAIFSPTNLQPLIGQELTAQGGHAISFYVQAGELKADVAMNVPRGFSKTYEGINVYVEQGADVTSLPQLNAKAQQHRIHFQTARGSHPARVVIYKGAGLVGGMLEGEEEASEDEQEDDNIPHECFCPITQVIMEDPVIAQDGHTYERAAIKDWLDRGNPTSPKTGAMLLSTELIPNHTMRSLIQDIKEQVLVLATHKVDMQNIEVAIKLREEEIAGILAEKGELIDKESQARLSLEEVLEEKERELLEKTAALSIMEHRIKDLEANRVQYISSEGTNILPQMVSETAINNLTSRAKAGDRRALMDLLDLGNNHCANAQFNLGVMYYNGSGMEKDKRKAFEWFEKAADQGHPKAQYNLGVMYETGQVVIQDYHQAFKWLQKAANQGHADAQHNLGIMCKKGYGVVKNDEKAVEWFKKSAYQGDADAQFNLGKMYEKGRGVIQDLNIAFEWFEKAAYQRNTNAQCKLALMYKEEEYEYEEECEGGEYGEEEYEKGVDNSGTRICVFM
jgi:TPR repeat protein